MRLFDRLKVLVDKRTKAVGGSLSPVDQIPVRFFYKQMLEYEAPIIVDVGAGVGFFVLLAKFHPGALVHAFEPVPFTCSVLEENVLLNELHNQVVIHNYALFDQDGTAVLKVPKLMGEAALRTGHSTLGQYPAFDAWTKLDTRTVRLDSLVWPRGIDLIKIDVEGAELAVLKGGEEVIRCYKPGILMEYTKTSTKQFGYVPGKLKKLLKSWGYSHFGAVGRRDAWMKC